MANPQNALRFRHLSCKDFVAEVGSSYCLEIGSRASRSHFESKKNVNQTRLQKYLLAQVFDLFAAQ